MVARATPTAIRPITISDLPSLIELIRTRDDTRPEDAEKRALVLEWLAFHNPMARGEPTYFVAEQEDRVVGHLGRMPVDMNDRGRDVRGAFGHDLFVHPDLRKTGHALSITARLYKALEDSTDGVVGLLWTNEVNLKIQRFRKYPEFRATRYIRVLDPTEALRRNERTRPIATAAGKTGRLGLRVLGALSNTVLGRKRRIEPVERFDARADEFFDSIRSKLGLGPKKTSRYLNWKYIDHPFAETSSFIACSTEGKVTGIAVVGKLRALNPPQGIFLELIADPSDVRTIHALCDRALHLLYQDPTMTALDVLSEDPEVGRALNLRLFLKREGTLMLLANVEKAEDQRRMLEPSAWNLSYGDSDGYVWIL